MESTDWSQEVVEGLQVEVVSPGNTATPPINYDTLANSGIQFTSDVQTPPPGMLGDRPGNNGSTAAATPNLQFSGGGAGIAPPPLNQPNPLAGQDKILPSRGVAMLVFGILSLLLAPCAVGAILGVVTSFYAHSDLREMKAGSRDASRRKLTVAARVLGMVACVLGVLTLVWGIDF